MKKLIYLFLTFSCIFTSCEPVEDIHEEIDATLDESISEEISFTFETEDYEATGVESIAENEYFSSLDSANIMIPVVLNEVYPALGSGAIVNATVDYVDASLEAENEIYYEVTEEDYEAMGLSYGNFDNVGDIYDFLDYKFPDATVGTLVALTYEYYDGETNTLSDVFFLSENGWIRYIGFNEDDYAAMGQGYPNFSSEEDALSIIPLYLKEKFFYAEEGDVKNVAYELHIGGGNTEFHRLSYEFDGTDWVLTSKDAIVTRTLQFGHNGEGWEPDNTIIYTLTPEDYDYIFGNEDNYGNFDYWDQEDYNFAEASVIEVLQLHFPDAEVGQEFLVYFLGYSGSVATYSVEVVVNENGEFVIVE